MESASAGTQSVHVNAHVNAAHARAHGRVTTRGHFGGGGKGSQRSASPTSPEIFFASQGRWIGMMKSPAPCPFLPVEKNATRRPSGLHAAYVFAPSCCVRRRMAPPALSVAM